jgi:hypothetical protein
MRGAGRDTYNDDMTDMKIDLKTSVAILREIWKKVEEDEKQHGDHKNDTHE